MAMILTLPQNMTIADFIKTIKIDSSKWIKTINSCYHDFAWQSGYGAFSVSPSVIGKTTEYIKNQSEHHRIKTFAEEYKSFLDAYGIQYDEKYLFTD